MPPTIIGVVGGYLAMKADCCNCACVAAPSPPPPRRRVRRGRRDRRRPPRTVMKPATGPALPWPLTHPIRGLFVERLPVGIFRDMGDGRQHLPGLRVVLAHGVLTDIDEPLFVDRHAVTLRRVERSDHVAGLVEVNHRRRMGAANRQRRILLRVNLDRHEIVGPVQHPDVVVLVDGQAGDASHLPFVRQRLRPVGIELEAGRGRLLGSHT